MKNSETWFAVEITVEPEASEAVEFALNELAALGTEINNLGKDKPRDFLRVVGYFNEQPSEESVRKELAEALRIYNWDETSIKNISSSKVENKDWLAEWKKHWKATETDKFIIAPPWEKIENTGKIVIRIEPNMAFGTGTHETTKLCLRAIEANYRAGESFLDVGTGTGILSIAAAKINAGNKTSNFQNTSDKKHFLACDTDEDSIKIAVENAELNDVKGIDFYVGSISKDTPEFDFVCANVTADVIIPMLPLLIEKTNKTLVLSGILTEQEISVTDEIKKLNANNLQTQIDGEWVSIVMKKTSEFEN